MGKHKKDIVYIAILLINWCYPIIIVFITCVYLFLFGGEESSVLLFMDVIVGIVIFFINSIHLDKIVFNNVFERIMHVISFLVYLFWCFVISLAYLASGFSAWEKF